MSTLLSSYNLRKRKRVYFFPKDDSDELNDLLESSEEYVDGNEGTDLDTSLEVEEDSDGEEISSSEEEMPNELVETIRNNIRIKCPSLDIPDSALDDFVGKAISAVASKDLAEEELDEYQQEECSTIREEIEKRMPSISKILSSPTTFNEKRMAIQLYDVMDQTMPNTDEYLALYNTFQLILSTKDQLSKEEKIYFTQLKKSIENDIPTLNQILSSQLPRSKKKEAIKLYNVMIHTDIFSLERIKLEKHIENLLSSEKYFIESKLNIEEFEKKEKEYKRKAVLSDVELQAKIFNLDASEEVKIRTYELYLKMKTHEVGSSEAASFKDKIVWATSLPHRRLKISNLNGLTPSQYCDSVRRRLDEKLYGLLDVKENIIRMVNNRLYNPKAEAMLGLKGHPGVGKTAIAQSLSYALDLPFERISLGGMVDASIFRGSDNVWVGSTPSIILQILKRMTFANGVILFDEIDKLGPEIQHALLHITDYTQNKDFQDLYLNEFPHDLSNIWFMFAMNSVDTLDPALLDRIEIIEVRAYSKAEKVQIIQKYLLPKHLKSLGIPDNGCSITKAACRTLINKTKSASIRPLSKNLSEVLSKINQMRSRLDEESEFPLSYDLPNFHGFPYEIKSEDINKLCKSTSKSLSYYI